MPAPAAGDAQRRRELACIHAAVHQVGLDDAAYRLLLKEQLGVDSSAKLDEHGRHKLLDLLRERGWRPPAKPATEQGAAAAPAPADGQAKKIRALWGELERRGMLKDPSVRALRSFVKRMTRADDARFLDAAQANVVIEALKGWLQRGHQGDP